MYRLYPAAVLAAAGVLAIACGDGTTPTPTEPAAVRLGRVKIDGVIGPNEWRDAAVLRFMASAPEGLVPAELLAQRDDRDLYLAIRIQRPAGGLGGFAEFEFDSDNDGVPFELLDDVFIGGGVPPLTEFGDNHVISDGVAADVAEGGTSDGVMAVGSDATSTTYEIRRPLDSGDIHDVRLTRASPQTGFELRIAMTIPGGTNPAASGEGTFTQVPTYGGGCKLTAFPAVSISGCPVGQLAMVRVTPNQSTMAVSLISMPTHGAFLEPLGLFTYDYLGTPVSASCTWQSTNPDVVQVDQQGHVTSGAAPGSSVVGAVCLNGAGRPILGSVRIDVSEPAPGT
jgi:hypothetical protein